MGIEKHDIESRMTHFEQACQSAGVKLTHQRRLGSLAQAGMVATVMTPQTTRERMRFLAGTARKSLVLDPRSLQA